jgi:hypothetical protein
MGIPKRALDRITANLKKYQTILSDAHNRDISESDTVVIIGDMLCDLLGYRKYVEITTEFAIRGTFVDLAVKVDDDVRFLVEAKAIGSELKDAHVKQAVDYGANQGIEWVILSNGRIWRVYKIHFQQPIEKSLVAELDLLKANARSGEVLDCLGSLSREGFTKSSMTEFFQQQQATGKFSVAAVLLSEPVIQAARRQLRQIFPSVRIDPDVLESVIKNEVLKRELVDGADAQLAQEDLKRTARAAARARTKAKEDSAPAIPGPANPAAVPHVANGKPANP